MNILVFATYNITPKQWAYFVETAAIPPQLPRLNEPARNPYVLVYSRSQKDCSSSTTTLSTTIETEFGTATYADLDAFSTTLSRTLTKQYFLVLDEQSIEDSKVTIIDKDFEWVDAEGEVDVGGPMERGNLKKRRVQRRFRVPFKKAFNVWVLLNVKPGMEGEEFLEEITQEWV